MHREIMGLLERGDMRVLVDHVNGLQWDNRRCNLRLATNSQNLINSGTQKGNRSGYRGVNWDRGRWRAFITCKRKRHHLGRFTTLAEAVEARNKAAVRLFGQFAFEGAMGRDWRNLDQGTI
jgi:hypothetical protein